MRTIIFVLAGLIFGAIVVAALRHRNADIGEPYYAREMASVDFAPAGVVAAKPVAPAKLPAVATPEPAVVAPAPPLNPAVAASEGEFNPAAGALSPSETAGIGKVDAGEAPLVTPAVEEPGGAVVRRFPAVAPENEPQVPKAPEVDDPAGGSFVASEPPAADDKPAAALEPPVVADAGKTEDEGTKAEDTVETAAADEDVTVYHAGKAVELKSPKGWKVYAFPAGRELWTVLSPTEIKPRSVLQHGLQDGVWITHHVRSTPISSRAEEISGMIAGRLRQNGDKDATPTGRKERFVDGRPTLLYQFEIPADGVRKPRQGMHAMVATQWGIVELHFIAFQEDYEQRYISFMSMLDGMKISAPRDAGGLTDPAAVAPEVKPAAKITGAWKAKRSLMRLFADGRIELEADRTSRHPINSVSFAKEPAPEVLKGKYQAQNDVLFVKWEDGSLLNFRWKIFKGALLLTDHEGEISHLERVLE